ncbi:MAG: hypothetical protein Q8P20_09185 [bacterium]|nr:hypothetical protein [bacterium]
MFKKRKHFSNLLKNNWWIFAYLILLVVSFSYFIYLQSSPTFADPDSFYHAKSALRIADGEIDKTFPWLQSTVLKDSYIDQHFLYHVFLIPFVKLMDPLLGTKLANIILSVSLVILFYWLMRKYWVKFAFWYAFLLMITTPFIFRINLIKAPVFSIIILLIGLYLLFDYRYKWLFVLSFLYVWAYGGFILILFFSGAYMVAGIYKDIVKRRRFRKIGLIIGHNRELKLFLTSLGGVFFGLIINPYFPQNLVFYWHQLVKIGIINQQSVIPVGNEWYPYNFFNLTAGTALMTILLVSTLIFFVIYFKKLNKKSLALFFIFLLFFIFTLKSRRYVEYYVPFTFLFIAFSINIFLENISYKKIGEYFIKFFSKFWYVAIIVLLYFAVMIPLIVVKDIKQTRQDFKNGISLTRFEKASTWLYNDSQPGDIVFHSSWDEFPILYYFNSKNYYIIGLDPTFAYEYDEVAYQKIVDITTGQQTENIYDDIKNIFKAKYLLIENNHQSMERNIKKEENFVKVYKDDEATIYEVL